MSHPNHSNAPGGPRAFDNTSKLVAIAIGVIAGILLGGYTLFFRQRSQGT